MANGALDEQEELRPLPPSKRKKRQRHIFKETLDISIEMIEKYCLSRLTWEEAKPFVDFLEKTYGLFPPKKVRDVIERINRHFDGKLFGKAIKAKQVIMKTAHFKSMNHITRNKHVNLGDDYEKE